MDRQAGGQAKRLCVPSHFTILLNQNVNIPSQYNNGMIVIQGKTVYAQDVCIFAPGMIIDVLRYLHPCSNCVPLTFCSQLSIQLKQYNRTKMSWYSILYFLMTCICTQEFSSLSPPKQEKTLSDPYVSLLIHTTKLNC